MNGEFFRHLFVSPAIRKTFEAVQLGWNADIYDSAARVRRKVSERLSEHHSGQKVGYPSMVT
jgi:hypothetical protein